MCTPDPSVPVSTAQFSHCDLLLDSLGGRSVPKIAPPPITVLALCAPDPSVPVSTAQINVTFGCILLVAIPMVAPAQIVVLALCTPNPSVPLSTAIFNVTFCWILWVVVAAMIAPECYLCAHPRPQSVSVNSRDT